MTSLKNVCVAGNRRCRLFSVSVCVVICSGVREGYTCEVRVSLNADVYDDQTSERVNHGVEG